MRSQCDVKIEKTNILGRVECVFPEPDEIKARGLKVRTLVNKGKVYPYSSKRQNTRRLRAKWRDTLAMDELPPITGERKTTEVLL